MKLSIILLNYNNERDTLECVESIKKKCTIDNEIIVIDNNSNDKSKKILFENSDMYKLICNKENNGFAAGNNIGIKYALKNNSDYILLLNNDTIITENSIEKLIECLESDKSIGIVSSRIMYYDKPYKIWFSGGKIDWFKYICVHDSMNMEFTNNNGNIKTEFISGCSMMIRKDVVNKVGLLPEEYFMYYEDVDYCKMVMDSGYKLMVCTESIIYHKVSASSGGEESAFSIKWSTRNRLIFMNKYKSMVSKNKFLLIKLYFYLTRCIRFFQYKFRDKNKAHAIIEGIIEGNRYINNMF